MWRPAAGGKHGHMAAAADDVGPSSSTIPREREPRWWESVLHAAALTVVTGVVVAGCLGLLGVRSGTVTAVAEGYRLEVTTAVTARPGLAAPFSVSVARTDGAALPGRIDIRIDADYLAIFDENGLDPDPADGFNDGRWIWWTFSVPSRATTFTAAFDARIEPGVQWKRDGAVAVEIDGRTVVSADVTTWVMP